MSLLKNVFKKAAKAVVIVIHDPEVDRSGRAFAALILTRVALAAGGGTFWVALIHQYVG